MLRIVVLSRVESFSGRFHLSTLPKIFKYFALSKIPSMKIRLPTPFAAPHHHRSFCILPWIVDFFGFDLYFLPSEQFYDRHQSKTSNWLSSENNTMPQKESSLLINSLIYFARKTLLSLPTIDFFPLNIVFSVVCNVIHLFVKSCLYHWRHLWAGSKKNSFWSGRN